MKTVDEYIDKVFEVRRLLSVFENYKTETNLQYSVLKDWTIEDIEKVQGMTQRYTPAENIWQELKEGFPTDEEMKRRLYYVFLDLGLPEDGNGNFPKFNADKYSLPSKDNPTKNHEMIDALAKINGNKWAFDVMVRLESIAVFSNLWIADVKQMLNDVCREFDYNPYPAPQEHKEAQQATALKDLLPEVLQSDEAIAIFQKAIDAKLVEKSTQSLMWKGTKQLLAYFAVMVSDKLKLTTRRDFEEKKTTNWKPFEQAFNKKDLKGAKQNWMRLNTRFEPTGFEEVDALF